MADHTTFLAEHTLAPDALSLIADMERVLSALRERADSDSAHAAHASELERELSTHADERARLLERQIALESQLASLRSTCADLETRASTTQSDLEAKQSDLQATRSDLHVTQSDLDTTRSQLASARSDLESAQSNLSVTMVALEATHANLVSTQSLYEALLLNCARTQSNLESTQTNLESTRLSAETTQLRLDEAEYEATAAQARADAAQFNATAASLSLADAQLRAESAERECARIEHEALEMRLAYSRQTAALLDGSESGHRDALAAFRTECDARIVQLESELSQTRDEFAQSTKQLGQLVVAAQADAARVQELEQELVQRDDSAQRVAAAHADASNDSSTDRSADIERARSEGKAEAMAEATAEAVAAAQIQFTSMMEPKLVALTKAAVFLRTRRARLNALHRGVKARMRELREERVRRPIVSGDAQVAAEREALANERNEITELRAMLMATEHSLAQRAAAMRPWTSAAISIAFAAAGALTSWHLSGAIAPSPVLATIDLGVTSRAPEAKQDQAADAAPIAAWITETLASEAFAGMVAGRLHERGRTRSESDAMALGLAQRLTIEQTGPTIRLGLRGSGADASAATLDAIATSVVIESNRDVVRRSDLLRVGIVNAKQEVGRAVFASVEVLPDPTRLLRAGTLFAGFALLAGLFVMTFTIIARKTARVTEHVD
jgi:predicted  nucleic acid-binding Zn-ribbon protein